MLVYILLLIIVIIIFVAYTQPPEITGGAELVLNKTKLVNKHTNLGYANFTSFMELKDFNFHLVCIIGEDKSGRSHLASLLEKKGYTVINERNEKGKRIKIPKLRQQFYIENMPPLNSLTEDEIKQHRDRIDSQRKKKYVITGNFTEDDLGRLFKGNSFNRNFLLLFTRPKKDSANAWHKATGEPKEGYDAFCKKSDALLKTYKNYRIYTVQNDYC